MIDVLIELIDDRLLATPVVFVFMLAVLLADKVFKLLIDPRLVAMSLVFIFCCVIKAFNDVSTRFSKVEMTESPKLVLALPANVNEVRAKPNG